MPQKAELVDEEAQDADDDGTENGNQDGTDGPGLQAGLDIHAAEAGNHVEVALYYGFHCFRLEFCRQITIDNSATSE